MKLSAKIYIVMTVLVTVFMFTLNKTLAGQFNNDSFKTQQSENMLNQHKQKPFFIENKGQMRGHDGEAVPFVLFKAEFNGIDIYVTEKGLSYVLLNITEEEISTASDEIFPDATTDKNTEKKYSYEWRRIDMHLENAEINKKNITTVNASITGYNYYLPHCPDGILDVKGYQKIIIESVYPGIDWVIYTEQSADKAKNGGLKYDFIVHPGADPAQIKLLYIGATDILQENGQNLAIGSDFGFLYEGPLYCYQKENRREVEAQFIVEDVTTTVRDDRNGKILSESYPAKQVSIELSSYDKTQILIIDPLVEWDVYIGGNGKDDFNDFAMDEHDNVYAIGSSWSTDFPTLDSGSGAFFEGIKGGGHTDVFIIKLDNNGILLWATYYGGNHRDVGKAISLDNDNNVFITGATHSDVFPLFNPGGNTYFQNTNIASDKIIFIKFNSDGVRLFATFYGGLGGDRANTIVTDNGGNVFIAGETNSAHTFPSYDPGNGAHYTRSSSRGRIFILKFSNTGERLWATTYGGFSLESAMKATIDIYGNLYVVGYTTSNNFELLDPGNDAYFQDQKNGTTRDGFILKFDNMGVLLWATLFGGSNNDNITSVTSDLQGNVYMTGRTFSSDFPMEDMGGNSYFQYQPGMVSAFILKFNPTGKLLWSTYFIANGGTDIVIDDNGNIFVVGTITFPALPTVNPGNGSYFQDTYGGGNSDGFLLQFSSTGFLKWSTYIGRGSTDRIIAVTIDSEGYVLIGGRTILSELPITGHSGQTHIYASTQQINGVFVIKLQGVECPDFNLEILTSADSISCLHPEVELIANSTIPGLSYSWSSLSFPVNKVVEQDTIIINSEGTYYLVATDSIGCANLTSINVNGNIDTPSVNFNVTQPTSPACNNGAIGASVSGGAEPYSFEWEPLLLFSDSISKIAEGCYTLTVTSSNGCSYIDSVCLSCDSVSHIIPIKQTQDVFTAYPNPAGEILYIESKQEHIQIRQTDIFDVRGREVMSYKAQHPTSKHSIHIHHLPQGIYFYRVVLSDDSLVRGKFVKR
ncbi:MAG: T9SS C-terminal target domain-containing protein [Chitinophagaceae bacterium]|nr:MAG: T9SS C-terminal target domain-containing protein [Chitinophagaceae bacterium]